MLSSCGNSSVGRAIPCQGIGRRFEPGFPLHLKKNQRQDALVTRKYSWQSLIVCSRRRLIAKCKAIEAF